jgi:ribosomal protein L11 methyltransferase
MQWLRVTLLTTRDEEERLSQEIIDITQGAGTEVLDRRAALLVPEAADLLPGQVLLRVYVEEHSWPTIQPSLESLQGLELIDYSPLDDDWQENWKRYFRPTQVSQRFLVRPPWEQADDAQPGRIELIIEPGMAFGTGTHETTRLCLQTLDNPRSDYSTVLDVGCGSGILSVAVAKLGAQEVTGIDVDPAALVATQENADRNRVGHIVSTSTAALSDVEGKWPLVIANILSSILISIREPLCARVATGGQLLLSGILVSEQDDVCDAFTALGLRCVDVHEMSQWCAVVMQKP